MVLKMNHSLAMHAGEWLKTEIVQPHKVNVKDLAAHFGVSRQALSGLLNGHAARTAEMAIRRRRSQRAEITISRCRNTLRRYGR